MKQQNELISYDYSVAKMFFVSTIVFGMIGMAVGVIIAFQMAFPDLNSGAILSFGRLRYTHTDLLIYGFTLSAIFSSWYYFGQRMLKVSMAESLLVMILGRLHFIVYIVFIIAGFSSLLLGYNTTREYSEFEWPIALLVVVTWVLWGAGMFSLMGIRREKSLYITIWYYIACFLGVAMLYLFNNITIPSYFFTGMGEIMHSVSIYAGTDGAMVQWWFGHNAVGLILTAPILGMMYYFLPKEVGQPIFSYKLSLISFWSFIFVYMWAGGHHLIYSTVPDWVQTMGSVFSVLLVVPSWGSAVNFLLTMKGEWAQLQTKPIVKFMVFAVTFYMLSTLEGPILSVKSVNALAHFTNWIPAHVHDGTLGWVGFTLVASLYYMIPRMFKKEIYSKKIMEFQFWIQTIGIVLYFASMWVAGITQGVMWRATDQYGNLLYSFIDVVNVLIPYYAIRAIGGTLYLIGFVLFIYNVCKSIWGGRVIAKEPQFATPIGRG